MKRELLELKQKVMQRFLDGAIDQETYDRMLGEIENMAQNEGPASISGVGPVVMEMPIPGAVPPAMGGGDVPPAVGPVPPMVPSFVTVWPAGAPGQMMPGYAYPQGGYPGMYPPSMGMSGMPGGIPYPAGMGHQNGMAWEQPSVPSRISSDKLEVRTAAGMRNAGALQEAAEMDKLAPDPEIDPKLLEILKDGETLEIWWHYAVTPECVSAWKKIRVPLRLSLAMNERVDDETLHLVGQITNLHELNLSSTRITDDGIRMLSRLTQLESLVLTSTEVTGETFDSLENCKNLRELALTSTPFTDEGMQFLPQFQLLDTLKLDDTNISDEGMPALEGLHQLQLLNIQGTIVSDLGLRSIAQLTSLVELYLGGTIPIDGCDYESPITDKGIVCIQGLEGLKVLHLNDTQVTNTCLRSMKKMNDLRELNLTDTYFSDDALKTLKNFMRLQEVVVDGTRITKSGVRKFFGHSSEIFRGAQVGFMAKLGRFLASPWSRKN